MAVDGSQPGRRFADNRSDGRHWFYLDPESEGPVRVDIYASARNGYGVEWWEFDRELEPGWRDASMKRRVGVY